MPSISRSPSPSSSSSLSFKKRALPPLPPDAEREYDSSPIPTNGAVSPEYNEKHHRFSDDSAGLEVAPPVFKYAESHPVYVSGPEYANDSEIPQVVYRRDSAAAPQTQWGAEPESLTYTQVRDREKAMMAAYEKELGQGWWGKLKNWPLRRWLWVIALAVLVAVVVGVSVGIVVSKDSGGKETKESDDNATAAADKTASSTTATTSKVRDFSGTATVARATSVGVYKTTTATAPLATFTDCALTEDNFCIGECKWGCQGTTCSDLNDCADPYPCVDGKCFEQNCTQPGRCIGVACSYPDGEIDPWCADGLVCMNSTCALPS